MNSSDHVMNQPESGKPLFHLFAVGVLAWALSAIASIVWFFATVSDPGLAGVAAPFYAWVIGFVPGAGVMLFYGAFRLFRRRTTFKTLGWALGIYLLPVAVGILVFNLFVSSQPLTVQGGNDVMMFSAFGGPLFFFLYALGMIAGFLLRERTFNQVIVVITGPPLAGILFIVCAFLWFTLTSSHWKNRGAFTFDVRSIGWKDPGLIVEGTLLIDEDKSALVHAFYQDQSGETGRGEPVDSFQLGRSTFGGLAWTKDPVRFQKDSSYLIRLLWPRLRTTSLNSRREVIFTIRSGPDFFSGDLLKEFRIPVDPDDATLEALESTLRPITRGGKTGYANRAEKMVVEPQFDWADEFSEGLAAVRVDGKFGFIDMKGNRVIDCIYDHATRFSGGKAAVGFQGRSGYIDMAGKEAIPFQYDFAHPFSDGLARVRMNGKDGFIDAAGTFVIKPQWTMADDFSNGRAAVRVNEKWGFIDQSGAMVIKPIFEGFQKFSNGRAHVMLGNQWGFVDKQGNWSAGSRQ
ncbi:MAG: WG repeat-containing protein [Ignavibacteriales bacterium]|nr:WG repeat-containing protein [Ignavibacteriales bacterium]